MLLFFFLYLYSSLITFSKTTALKEVKQSMVRVRWSGIPDYTSWPQLTSPFSAHIAETASDTGFFCFYNHKKLTRNTDRDGAMRTEKVEASERGKKNNKSTEGRSRQHSPQSFSGYCCSSALHHTILSTTTAGFSEWLHHICVSGREGEREREWQTDSGSIEKSSWATCRVYRQPTEVSVF